MIIETRKSRGPTRDAELARRAEVSAKADQIAGLIGVELTGCDPDFAFDVLRRVARAIGAAMVRCGSEARSAGVLAGALAAVAPAYTPGTRGESTERERVFGGVR